MLLGVIFYLLEYTFDALRTKILIKGTGNKLSMFECYKIVAIQVFFNLITPFSFGGQPLQVYVLKKKNIPIGSSTTVVMIKLIFGAIALFLIVIYAMLFHSGLFISIAFFKVMINVTGIIFLVIIVLFLLALYNPRITTVILSGFFFILFKLKVIKYPERIQQKILRHIILARDNFNQFMGNKFFYFITGFVLSFLMILSMIMMILCFIWGFNLFDKIGLFEGIATTAALIFITTFMPTPGSSGLGEGVFYLLYRDFIPGYLIGVLMFLWRFFAQYLTAFLGAVITAHYGMELLSRKKIKGQTRLNKNI